jgi:carboxypeptidase C (cathepsin A)
MAVPFVANLRLILVVCVLALGINAAAADAPPMPPEATSQHRIGDLAYTAKAAVIEVKREKTARFFHIAYTLDGANPAERPVSFVFNGGPGAASVYLHLGALGPKVVEAGPDGALPSRGAGVVPNPDTWLGFTDLVFVDPVGTGFSRSDEDKAFWGVAQDLDALADFIRQWTQANGRELSPKYLVGESYGGFRAARLPQRLGPVEGVGIAGIVLVSPALEFGLMHSDWLVPLADALRLPAYAATALEQSGRFTFEALAEAEAFALGDYLLALVRGEMDEAMIARIAGLTGLPEPVVSRSEGRISVETFMKEFRRGEGLLVSRYDGTVSGADPYPRAAGVRGGDPLLEATIAPLASAMLAYLRDELGVATDIPYRVLNRDTGRHWDWKDGSRQSRSEIGAGDELREALARDRRLRVLIAHGVTDLQTSYLASRYVVDHLPRRLRGQITFKTYPGGHMMYFRADSRAALRHDAEAFYRDGG